ncbi:MAG: hypothetical protein A2787_05470 [Omnitrophica WOR_2 bacterium RIFCSPHIGHO2_01_FULL_48_9]|nr:MAG: hypothetical protein A3D10_06210 [Omnitrophica WOR_2 bacterium RIFCSPHIGHO2_02_FULL_48_11]OGX32829.1 MAG: hypothetical protein A2787_05470 [Omnitrophica WOR_2 bacterium RIFCSPHIGHO2_01_FULL_48_9]
MRRVLASRHAQSTIEYILLVTFLLAALVIFSNYIKYGFTGRWRSASESMGFGLHFLPRNTIECKYDNYAGTTRWYDDNCFDDRHCDCFSLQQNSETCRGCILSCVRTECD